MKLRKILVQRWEEIDAMELKKGDVFRMIPASIEDEPNVDRKQLLLCKNAPIKKTMKEGYAQIDCDDIAIVKEIRI